jgi:hypothetical protein
MQTCEPLEHPSASVRRSNIECIARLGGAFVCSSPPSAPRPASFHCSVGLSVCVCVCVCVCVAGGDAELQKLARIARCDVDASCRATAVAAMVAIRLFEFFIVHFLLLWRLAMLTVPVSDTPTSCATAQEEISAHRPSLLL